jgi:cell division protein FtsL
MSGWRMSMALLAAILIFAVQVVLHQHQARRVFVDVQALEQERDRLNDEWGRLQLEQSTWATDARVESIARTQLHMLEPDRASVELLR